MSDGEDGESSKSVVGYKRPPVAARGTRRSGTCISVLCRLATSNSRPRTGFAAFVRP